MKILLTGSNGFLGSYISKYFRNSAHEITTLSRSNADLNLDLNKITQFIDGSFDLVIHAAGKAHFVPKTIEDAKTFLDINVTGTRNFLMALESQPPQRFVFISSVAVYGRSSGVLLDTNTPILAVDPYGISKIQAEANVLDWCQRHKVICTILRLPLVFGNNPPGNLKSMIKGIKKGYYFNIAGGKARKSMVRAEDIARFILPASEVGGIYHLTDGCHPSFKEFSHFIGVSLGRSWIPDMPLWLANIVAKIGDKLGSSFPLNSEKLVKITSELTFDDSLAKSKFGWAPKPVVNLEVLK
jgi:nucleoside-diphosphate-sugar epimerase